MRKLRGFAFPVLIGICLLVLAACGGKTAATPIPTVTGDAKGEGFEFRYVCVNRTLLSCQVVQQFMDSVRARTNGQIGIQLSSYSELGIRGFDMIHLLKDGSLGLGEIYSGLVGGEFPVFEAANLFGAPMSLSTNGSQPQKHYKTTLGLW